MKSSLDTTLRTLPQRPGVYLFRDRRESALYVGRAAQLRRRVRSYWGPLDDRPHLRAMVRRVRDVEVTVCETEHAAAFVERDLIARSEEHTSELQSHHDLVCRLLLEKKKK